MVATTCQIAFTGNYETNRPAALFTDTTSRAALDWFNQIVIEYQDDVYRQAYWIMGDEDAAEDAAQEAFLRAYRNLHTYNGGPIRPWILRIATNYCLDQLRRRKFRKTVPLEAYDENEEEIETPSWLRDPNASVEDMIERADERARIAQAIRRLPADYQAAILLADVQGMDYNEAATTLSIPLGTFKSRLSRARVQLQKTLLSMEMRPTVYAPHQKLAASKLN